ncbi:disease resistance protein RUN1-like [Diospyros lotus]|uniref:disease resistance protein RUN1-like n=1 Tax=Diospyros lotus TaxID=55363 RepID=UPI002252E864|nr:disease resistance protein RUN1-like [Diospyros lotus]
MECKKKLHHIVLPIYCEIEPLDLRVQKGSIAGALASHKEIDSKMQTWTVALTEAANLSSWVKTNMGERDEVDLIENIVVEVANKLSPMHLNVADYLVGIMSRLQKLTILLHLESSDNIRIVAIWGIGGIGKTTIVKAAYNSFRHRFEGSSFVAELKALAIDPKFFYCGSRIIMTTRNISSLNSLKSVAEVYTLEQLDKYESLQLFSWHAFKDHRHIEKYMDLSNEVMEYAKGIPLTLEVLGCFLFGKTKS